MKLEILNENQNNVLQRKELQVAIDHENEPTPSKAALQELISKQLEHNKEKIDVRSIYSDKGRARSLSKIFVWEEPPPKKMKEEKKEQAKEETKPETKEEKKAEAKKEKTEKKKEESKAEVKEEKKEETEDTKVEVQ